MGHPIWVAHVALRPAFLTCNWIEVSAGSSWPAVDLLGPDERVGLDSFDLTGSHSR